MAQWNCLPQHLQREVVKKIDGRYLSEWNCVCTAAVKNAETMDLRSQKIAEDDFTNFPRHKKRALAKAAAQRALSSRRLLQRMFTTLRAYAMVRIWHGSGWLFQSSLAAINGQPLMFREGEEMD